MCGLLMSSAHLLILVRTCRDVHGGVRLGSAPCAGAWLGRSLSSFPLLSWKIYLCHLCFPSCSSFTASPFSRQARRHHHAGAFGGGPEAVDGGDGRPGAGEQEYWPKSRGNRGELSAAPGRLLIARRGAAVTQRLPGSAGAVSVGQLLPPAKRIV